MPPVPIIIVIYLEQLPGFVAVEASVLASLQNLDALHFHHRLELWLCRLGGFAVELLELGSAVALWPRRHHHHLEP